MTRTEYLTIPTGESRLIEKPTVSPDVRRVSVGDNQSLTVSTFDGGGNSVTLVTIPWSEYGDRDDAAARYALLAEKSKSTVMVIDNPGIGHSSPMTGQQHRALARGDTRELSELQWEALRKVDVDMSKFALMGYSLGSSMAMGIAAEAPRGTKIDQLVVAEPVLTDGFISLATGFIADGIEGGHYRKENPEWFQDLPHPMFAKGDTAPRLQRGRALWNYIRYMSLPNSPFDNMRNIDTLKDTSVTLVAGEKSRLAPQSRISRLAHTVDAERLLILRGDNHGVIDNLAYAAAMGAYLEDNHTN